MTVIYRKLVHRTPSQWCNSNPYRLFCRGESGGCNPSQSIAATRVVFTTNRPRLFQGAPLAVQLTDPPSFSSSLTVSIWGKCWRPISRIRSCFIPCVFQFDSSVPEMWILSIPQMLRQPGDHHGYWYQLAKGQDEQSTKGSLCIHMNYYWQQMHTSWYGP